MAQPPSYLYVIAASVILLSFAVAIWPTAVVRFYERTAAKSTDAFSPFTKVVFDPKRRTKNAFTLRLVGALGVLFGCVILALVFASRV